MAREIDLNEGYENFVHTQEYNYGEYFEQLDLVESILAEVNSKHLEKGLSEYLAANFSEYISGKKGSKGYNKRARHKARTLINGNYEKYDYLAQFNSREGYKNLVRSAVSEGFVWKFRIDEPWHASFAFDENRIFTYPFQHKFMILYTGQAKHVFFSEEGKWDLLREDYDVNDLRNPDIDTLCKIIAQNTSNSPKEVADRIKDMSSQIDSKDAEEIAANRLAKEAGVLHEYRNPDSILKQGAIFPGNQHVAGDDEKDYDEVQERAVWLAFLDKAKNYPAHDEGMRDGNKVSGVSHPKLYEGAVVLEVEVPTNWIAIKENMGWSFDRIESLEDCINNFGSPKEMASHLDRDNEFVIPSSTGRLPLHYIKGVWDKGEFPDAPHFMSLESFVDLMEQKFPGRMPGGSAHIESGDVSKKDLESLEERFEIYKEIGDLAEKFSTRSEKIVKWIKRTNNSILKIEELEEKIRAMEQSSATNENIDRSKKKLKQEIEDMKDKGTVIFNHSNNRMIRFSELLELLESTSINVDPSQINKIDYGEHMLLMKERDEPLPGYKIKEEVNEAEKRIARKWEKGEKQGAKQIISKLEGDIEAICSEFYFIEYDIEALIKLVNGSLSQLSQQNCERVKKNIIQGWKEAEDSINESFTF